MIMRDIQVPFDRAKLQRVKTSPALRGRELTQEELEAKGVGKAPVAGVKRWYKGPNFVSAEVIAETKTNHETCRCDDPDFMATAGYGKTPLPHLYPNMPVDELQQMEGGCRTGRWVCPRLDSIRRRLGR